MIAIRRLIELGLKRYGKRFCFVPAPVAFGVHTETSNSRTETRSEFSNLPQNKSGHADRLSAFSPKELEFIRSRGVSFGKGCAWQGRTEASEAFTDGWSIVATMLNGKGASEEEARKAAAIFTDAAWAEWRRLNPDDAG